VTGRGATGPAADPQAGAAPVRDADASRRRGRRRVAAVAAVVAVAAIVATGLSGAFRGAGSPAAAAGKVYRTGTAVVTRRSLESQTQVDATLGDAGSYTVVNQDQGTITALPAIGQVVGQGRVLYQVSGSPVVLLYGTVPAWRDLSEGAIGADVTELNADLVRLGYATSAELGPRSGWDYFSGETAAALAGLQAHLGLTVTGTLPLGQAVFLPGAAQITAMEATTVLGGTVMPGTVLLTATSTTPVVTVGLDPGEQTEVKVGDHVSVTLPDGQVTPGVVASVGTVATAPASESDSSAGGAGPATITVEVTLSDPQAASHLDQAPVEVAITTGSVASALVVPVDALLAQASGGYAVQVSGPAAQHLVPVTVGLFDDAAGLVQVSGARLAVGQRVVVPAL
jgi:putative peptidoglycan binding protein